MATQEEYINSLYDKQRENALAGLKSAYEQNVTAVKSAEQQLDPTYYEQQRAATAASDISRLRLNENLAANGLNTGAVGQANLALGNAKAADYRAIALQKQEERNQLAQQRLALETAYRNNVQQAIADNDFNRANALYAAWKAQQTSGGSGVYRSANPVGDDDDLIDDTPVAQTDSEYAAAYKQIAGIQSRTGRVNVINAAYKDGDISLDTKNKLMKNLVNY